MNEIEMNCSRCWKPFTGRLTNFPMCPGCTERRANLPYPVFCSMPEKCAGKAYCQRERCCAD